MDLRCPGKKQAALVGDLIEVKCDSRICGAGRGVVVLHRFHPVSGELVETKRFRDPMNTKGVGTE